MADVLRLNQAVLVGNYQNDQGVSFREAIGSLVASVSAGWEKARAKDIQLYKVKNGAIANAVRNGNNPLF